MAWPGRIGRFFFLILNALQARSRPMTSFTINPPGFAEMDPQRLLTRCDDELRQRRARMQAMIQGPGPGTILDEFNDLSVRTGRFDESLGILQNASPDPAMRNAAQTCLERLMPFATELFQSAALHARVLAFTPGDVQEASYRQWLLEQFDDAGASLPADKQARAKAIQDELVVLCLQFQKNVNDVDTTLALTEAQIDGLPQTWIDARPRDSEGHLLVSLDYPCYGPFMELATHADARRRLWMAFQNRAGLPNLELMDRALVLRHELAQLYGLPDFATFSLRRKMAGTPQAVQDFLQSVHQAVSGIEALEMEDLRLEKASLMGCEADDVTVERWDVAFLQHRIKLRRFDVDPEALRQYFPTDASVRFVLNLAERLYGIRFRECQVPVWHDEVRYLEVIDSVAASTTEGTVCGAIYLDLFPRPGKFSHAAVFSVRRGSVLAGVTPIKALVCNFNKHGLTPSELETLFHEFGHALHGVLSRARFADQSGTSVRHDFVEVPSLMFEEWARRQTTLDTFAEVCPEAPRLSSQQLSQLAAARQFGAGMRYARQWMFASYDLALHTGAPRPAMALWTEMESRTRLGHVDGSMMPASFGHLMGGYEAGYYSYMWSEVLALDMLSAYQGNLLDPVVGQRYRRLILEPGGSRPPQELVEEFLGRKPGTDAFFAEITGQRQ
jgi:thimet oligopeptidase